MRLQLRLLVSAVLIISACDHKPQTRSENWQQLFNGRDLHDWTPIFSGLPAGENYLETFRVEDGMLTVSYDQWDSLGGRFGHLFYAPPFSHYKLRAEYRFMGEQVVGGPEWAYANNGLMLHCQSPETMTIDQDFPLSLEFQLLGQRENGVERPCGNLCTPGTTVKVAGQWRKEHCLRDFSGPTFPLEEWVLAEAVVYGDSLIHHILKGDTVLTYTDCKVDGDLGGLDTKAYHAGDRLDHGYIAIQAESHGIQFRKIEIMELE